MMFEEDLQRYKLADLYLQRFNPRLARVKNNLLPEDHRDQRQDSENRDQLATTVARSRLS